MFGDHYWFVDNTHTRPNIDIIKRKVSRWLNTRPSSEAALNWIAGHHTVSEAAKPKAVPTRVSAGVVITDGERIVIGHPTNGITWDIPKGGVDPGETHAQAAVREMREETGLKIQEKNLVHLGVYPYSSEKQLSVFVLRVSKLPDPKSLYCDSKFEDVDGEMRPELDDFRIITRKQVSQLLKPTLQRIISENQAHIFD